MDIDEVIHNFHQLWQMRPWPIILLVSGFALFLGLVVDVWVIKKRRRRKKGRDYVGGAKSPSGQGKGEGRGEGGREQL